MKIKNLIKHLGTKNQELDVEYVVCTKLGNIVCMDISTNAQSLVKVLEHFPQGDKKGTKK